MNQVSLLTITLLLMCANTLTVVQAQPYNLYFNGNFGMAMPHDNETRYTPETDLLMDFDLDNGLMFSGTVGLTGDMYRSAIELSIQSHNLNGISVSDISIFPDDIGLSRESSAMSALLNAYFDFNLGVNIKPYLTAGVGISNFDLDAQLEIDNQNDTYDNSDTAFAYRFGGGFGFDLSENFTIDLGYRYFSAHPLSFETLRTEVKSHNLSAGFRFRY